MKVFREVFDLEVISPAQPEKVHYSHVVAPRHVTICELILKLKGSFFEVCFFDWPNATIRRMASKQDFRCDLAWIMIAWSCSAARCDSESNAKTN